jgi:Na+/Pi-cotransporter
MLSLEEGFKTFTGGTLEKILKSSTNSVWKSMTFGVVTTSVMQSSSLVSVITISFLSAGLLALTSAIGIIFGANLGTTTGAWLVAGFGLKVNLSAYAMPMLVFGIIQVTEPDAGGFKQPKLAAGIDATDRCTRCHLECLFDPFESFALRDNAPVQINGVFAGRQAGQEMVEGDHTLDFDVRDIQCVTARQNMLSTDVTMLILDFPQMVKQLGALEGEVFVWSAGCRCFFLVHSHFLSHLRAGFRKHCTPRKNPLVGAG